MENLYGLWSSSGLAQLQAGQVVMILIGFGLLYLAIVRNFEPLLLVPIGFGGILANIPAAGLALPAVERALAVGDVELLAQMATALGQTASDSGKVLLAAYGDADFSVRTAVDAIVASSVFGDGMLYSFYSV